MPYKRGALRVCYICQNCYPNVTLGIYRILADSQKHVITEWNSTQYSTLENRSNNNVLIIDTINSNFNQLNSLINVNWIN